MIESPYLDAIVEEQVALRLEKRHAERVAQLKREHAEQLAELEQIHAAIMAQLKKDSADRIARQAKERVDQEKEHSEWLASKFAEKRHADALRILHARFGSAANSIRSALEKVADKAELDALADFAVACPDLDAFRQRLSH
jgi:hypothetical protein